MEGAGTVTLGAVNSFGGGITLAGGALTLGVAGAAGDGNIIFQPGTTETLQIDGAIMPGNTVSGIGVGDTIDLAGVTYQSGAQAILSDGTLTVTSGAVSGTLSLADVDPDITRFSTTRDANGGTQVETLCFCQGTPISTPNGERLVENLTAGDSVTTASGEQRRVVWIGTGHVMVTRGRRSPATPVIVKRGALADNVPYADLRVTKGHSLFLEGVLIPVEFLVNHRSIIWDDHAQEVGLYHVELETHDVLLAAGAPAESYRDDGNRWLFQNANRGWAESPKPPCAPVLTGGALVDAAWRRLLDRAGPRPGLPLTDMPDLHLLVDDARVDAVRCHQGAYIFALRRRPSQVRLVSRSGVPAELGLARDPRELGVGVTDIVVLKGTKVRVTEAVDASLETGFHGFEPVPRLRWTNGDATLPATLFAEFDGPFEVRVQVGATSRYLATDDTLARAAA